MFHKLLVPLDATVESAVALPLAKTLASATGADVTLLRVVESRSVEPIAAANLGLIAHELAGAVPVEPVVRMGDPADKIVREAKARKCDLIVMATHGRSGVGRALLGSVTERVLASSPAPVLALRPGGQRVSGIQKLLVPVDGTPGGAVARGAALGLARHTGAVLQLLQVVVAIPAYVYDSLPGATVGGYVDAMWDDDALTGAQSYVDALVARLTSDGIAAEGRAVYGAVPETIVRVAEGEGADMIVMSTHALTGPARAALGSVADAVVRTSSRPVLLVRRESMADRDGRASEVSLLETPAELVAV